MFKFLKDKRIKSAIKKNERQHTFLNIANMKNILILFDNKDLNEIIHIAKELDSMGKRIFLWTYDPDKNAIPAKRQSLSLQTITPKDVSSIGSISKELIAVFESQIYDTIIDLTTENHYALKYLLSNNTAKFSIGTCKSDDRLYDFVLLKEENMGVTEVYDQIKFYLSNIRS